MNDPIHTAARFLTTNLDWLRHATDEHGNPFAAAIFATIADCAGRMRGTVNGPADQKFLGPCGAVRHCEGLEPDDWPEGDCGNHTPHPAHDREPCDGDVYGYVGAEQGRCRTCGATVSQDERRAWLDGLTRDRAYRASEIEDAHGIKAHSIRNWADKGRIRVHGHDHLGRNLYLLGDVLDHARDLATRKAENQAKRAARASA